MKTAREIAARVWCDQEMRNTAMDVDAAEEIATIIKRVLHKNATGHDWCANAACPICTKRKCDSVSGFITPEQAQAAYDAAPAVPLSDERIQEIVNHAVGKTSEPATHEEARWFHEGVLSGATAYAAAAGHSTLKSNNPKLCEVFDAQGRRLLRTARRGNEACGERG